jgi:hypothetical protein
VSESEGHERQDHERQGESDQDQRIVQIAKENYGRKNCTSETGERRAEEEDLDAKQNIHVARVPKVMKKDSENE